MIVSLRGPVYVEGPPVRRRLKLSRLARHLLLVLDRDEWRSAADVSDVASPKSIGKALAHLRTLGLVESRLRHGYRTWRLAPLDAGFVRLRYRRAWFCEECREVIFWQRMGEDDGTVLHRREDGWCPGPFLLLAIPPA